MNLHWTRSTACQGGGCVEAAWTRSSYCANGACVEATCEGERILVRDTAGTIIELRLDVWNGALTLIAAGRTPTNVRRHPDGGVDWVGMPPYTGTQPVTLRYDAEEWAAFAAGVKAGEFTPEALAGAAAR